MSSVNLEFLDPSRDGCERPSASGRASGGFATGGVVDILGAYVVVNGILGGPANGLDGDTAVGDDVPTAATPP